MESILCVGALEMKIELKGCLNVESALENDEKEKPRKSQIDHALAWRGQLKARSNQALAWRRLLKAWPNQALA